MSADVRNIAMVIVASVGLTLGQAELASPPLSRTATTPERPLTAPSPETAPSKGDAANTYAAQWDRLVKADKLAQARTLCQGWTTAKAVAARTEGEKCLAMLDLKESEGPMRLNPFTGAELGLSYVGPGVDSALAHMNRALELSPQDLTIHRARLRTLLQASRFAEMTDALEESLRTYKGPEGLEAWESYPSLLMESEQLEVARGLLVQLDAAYPGTRKVIANLGVVLLMTGQNDEAFPYLKRAAEMSPMDPLDNWNLARYYDITGAPDLADPLYRKAMSLQKDPVTGKEWMCVYAGFLETKRHDLDTACRMQKQSCPQDQWTACAAGGLSKP